jgi:hypothetical protein
MLEQRLTLIAVLISRDECTHAEVVKKFEDCARNNDEDATLSVRTLRRWIAGDVRTAPRPSQRRVARLFWGYPMADLLAPAPAELVLIPAVLDVAASTTLDITASVSDRTEASMPTDEPIGSTSTLERQVAMAARRATKFAAFAEIDNVGPEKIGGVKRSSRHRGKMILDVE